MRCKLSLYLSVLLAAQFFFALPGFSQNAKPDSPPQTSKELALAHASMCEDIKDYAPYNSAAVFSIAIGKVSCFTSFDPVPEKTHIFHKWYHQDKISTKKRLYLQPPRWSTYSSIQLRETDKGPWRVEILDHKGNLLNVLRFSITD